ncbi:MAG TPA: cytochrome c3 family protein [Terriglobia bacterium]|nr:cytochrome c3 family protein [Terriglobia bacterium]
MRRIALLAAIAALAGAPSHAQQTAGAAADYVGSESCGICHAEYFEQFKKTYMYTVLAEKYPVEQQGCEACHGPGRAHVEAASEAADEAARQQAATLIYSFARHSSAENAAKCLACHRKNENERHFTRSTHLAAGVFCADCHTAHLTATAENPRNPSAPLRALFSVPNRDPERQWLDNRLLKMEQPQLCYTCHKDLEAQFQLPVRHRVNEGLVKCTDCHNPHGALSDHELRAGNHDTCMQCHVEKGGPFLYEHAAARIEGCTACHTPHGSVNLNLMKRRQQRQLCLECHVPPEAAGVPHPRLGFQASGECTRCHVDIHGSNYQEEFLR